MQHKFCLIDDKVLMTGTLDWGNDRSADNWNYVYITSKPQLVQPVKNEFYQMWDTFSSDIEPSKKPSPNESGEQKSSDSEIEDFKSTDTGTIRYLTAEDLDPNTNEFHII